MKYMQNKNLSLEKILRREQCVPIKQLSRNQNRINTTQGNTFYNSRFLLRTDFDFYWEKLQVTAQYGRSLEKNNILSVKLKYIFKEKGTLFEIVTICPERHCLGVGPEY